MSEPDQRMRLIAELTSKISDPMKRMQRDVESFAKSGKDLQGAFKKFGVQLGVFDKQARKAGHAQVPALRREFEALRGLSRKISPSFASAATEVTAFGRGAGAAVGVVAAIGVALVAAYKTGNRFAAQLRELRFGAIETGLSPAQLEQLRLGASEYGLTADQMDNAMRSFAQSMVLLHKHQPEMLLALAPAHRFTAELEQLADHGGTVGEELVAAIKAMDAIKAAHPGVEGQILADKLASLFGLPKEMARLSSDEFDKLMDITREFGPDPFKLKQAIAAAQAFNEAIRSWKVRFDNWGDTLKDWLLVKPAIPALHLFNLLTGPPQPGAFPGGTRPVLPPSLSRLPALPGPRVAPVMPTRDYTPYIPHFARGGLVTRPTFALIGERGPEAVIPLGGDLGMTKGQQAMAMAMIYPEAEHGGARKKGSTLETKHEFSGGRLSQARKILRHSTTLAERVIASTRFDDAAMMGGLRLPGPKMSAGRHFQLDLLTLKQAVQSSMPHQGKLWPATQFSSGREQLASHPVTDQTQTWRETLATADDDRMVVNSAPPPRRKQTKVVGDGWLVFNVQAPPGTKVNASSGGMFKRVDLQRSVKMAG
jgi:hypothetical protein